MLFSMIFTIFNLIIWGLLILFLIKLFRLIFVALKKYINSNEIRTEKDIIKKSLGEILKEYRIKNNMTQEFVAEYLGVSRQSVSKWETGTSDPSTSNLLALSKLYKISPEELLSQIK